MLKKNLSLSNFIVKKCKLIKSLYPFRNLAWNLVQFICSQLYFISTGILMYQLLSIKFLYEVKVLLFSFKELGLIQPYSNVTCRFKDLKGACFRKHYKMVLLYCQN